MTEEQQTATREYVVLQKRTVAIFRDGEPESERDTREEWTGETFVPILDTDGKPKRFTAVNDDDAIEQYCGEPVKIPGTYKAIAWRNYGGSKTKRPATITETLSNDDE